MTNIRAMWRTAPVASDSGPTMKPGVSQRNTIGTSNASQHCMNRAALSAAGRVDRATEMRRVVRDDADGSALDRASAR